MYRFSTKAEVQDSEILFPVLSLSERITLKQMT